jgi:hypothetical protein
MVSKFKGDSFLLLVLFVVVLDFFLVNRSFFFGGFFSLDVSIVLYVLLSFFSLSSKGFYLLSFTYELMLFLFFVLLFSFLFLIFSNDIYNSLLFVVQYVFIIVMLPLFVDCVLRNNHLNALFYFSYFLFFLFSVFYFYVYFFASIDWEFFFKAEGDTSFGKRFFLGEFTPNEMGYYFSFFLLCFFYIKKTVSNRLFFLVLLIFPIVFFSFGMTLSKSVWIQMLFSILLFSKKRFLIFVCFFAIVLGYEYKVFFDSVINDFSANTKSNSIRIQMLYDSLKNLQYSFLTPAYHQAENLVDKSLYVTSVHNVPLSFVTNFGMVSFLFFVFGVGGFLFFNYRKSNKIFLCFIFIYSIVAMFNPMINARHVWLPLILMFYLYFYYGKSSTSIPGFYFK